MNPDAPRPPHSDVVVIYTSSACAECLAVKSVLRTRNVPYLEVDLESDPVAREYVQGLNHGFASVPTIVFPDGSILVEPSLLELAAKFSDS
jgi:mycoredoxin